MVLKWPVPCLWGDDSPVTTSRRYHHVHGRDRAMAFSLLLKWDVRDLLKIWENLQKFLASRVLVQPIIQPKAQGDSPGELKLCHP
jgi:hypothetical protein